ncbi:(2Fe-2S)-binding protein [Cellulomonas sp. APG4]|uniref:DUF2231 domain-containing protein n=1 Tax=Cellulomonas sp. APG4 TaxID=1538656 RepID=UPI00137B5797|nr:(2Fe-2S)-binding protein [Cellulomonas sp. APG4]
MSTSETTRPAPAHAADAPPLLVRASLAVERAQALDPLVETAQPWARALVDGPVRQWLLLGRPLGHALHPVLTDAPLGLWMSASALDLLAGPDARPAARRLVGLGVLSAVPTALTGAAEWSRTRDRDARVGVAHAVGNSVGLALYGASWLARRRGRHVLGATLALAGAGVAGASGYLGAHLAVARDVGSRDPAFAEDAATA